MCDVKPTRNPLLVVENEQKHLHVELFSNTIGRTLSSVGYGWKDVMDIQIIIMKPPLIPGQLLYDLSEMGKIQVSEQKERSRKQIRTQGQHRMKT